MSFIVSHPTGTPFVRGVLTGLSRSGNLAEFWTSVAFPSRLAAALPQGRLRQRALQRSFPETGAARIVQRPARDLVRTALRLAKSRAPLTPETGWASSEAVNGVIDRGLARRLAAGGLEGVTAVYCYEDVALESFRAASERGLRRVYDLPIAYWRTTRRLLSEEAERHPEWAGTMSGLSDSTAKLERKDAEIRLADRIVVASSFTRRSLEAFGSPLPPVEVISYGCPAETVSEPARRAADAPLHIFYAGQLGQRKGFADLITALGRLDVPWRLSIAGALPPQMPVALDAFLRRDEVTYLGAIPHAELMRRFARAHVFLFPSIVEGFAMVVTEAMACGLVPVASEHTCAPDVITEGRDGFVIPIRDPEAIVQRLTACHQNEERRFEMARNAVATARNMTWDAYADQVATRSQGWS